MRLEAAMRQHAMEPDGDPEPGKHIHHRQDHYIAPGCQLFPSHNRGDDHRHDRQYNADERRCLVEPFADRAPRYHTCCSPPGIRYAASAPYPGMADAETKYTIFVGSQTASRPPYDCRYPSLPV